ncbi:hypothetical protein TIFTF001_041322 [Ficus carica]|uniref:Uncharacterized protein n=1 Tax=Ficus carica TaxID=3494 RepID=A0AA87ZCQ6_FICCA|nr:hypothetical protein TIFTF001_041278 [Ficus carica]GMN29501.1 hypothetical protein TIFTF001_041322 [Ficus carica]
MVKEAEEWNWVLKILKREEKEGLPGALVIAAGVRDCDVFRGLRNSNSRQRRRRINQEIARRHSKLTTDATRSTRPKADDREITRLDSRECNILPLPPSLQLLPPSLKVAIVTSSRGSELLAVLQDALCPHESVTNMARAIGLVRHQWCSFPDESLRSAIYGLTKRTTSEISGARSPAPVTA